MIGRAVEKNQRKEISRKEFDEQLRSDLIRNG